MSLLGSIFGADADANKTISTSHLLFEKSEALPERPQHKPIGKIKRQKQKAEGSDGEKEPKNSDSNEEEYEQLIKDTHRTIRKKRKTDQRKNEPNDTNDDIEATSVMSKTKVHPENKVNSNEDDNENMDANSPEEKFDKHNSDEDERTIFVGNLPLATTTRKSLAALFKDCGQVASARIRAVPVKGIKLPQDRAGDQRLMKKVCVNTNQIDDSLKKTVIGYVVFKDIESANKALAKNNSMVVDGLRLRIDRGTPTVDASRSVFVGNLPYGAEESSLQQHFIKGCDLDMGDVDGVRIVRDKDTYQCKGFGYILFRDKVMVSTALKMNGSAYMHKSLRVMVCGKRFKGKQGDRSTSNKAKNSSPTENSEKVTVGAFRRIIAKQQKDSLQTNKRKRGEKKTTAVKAASGGKSKRAALDKKVDRRIKKLEKRVSKGMGKTRRS